MTAFSTRRRPGVIAVDRFELLVWFASHGTSRAPSWARPTDLAALVADGRLIKVVRKEYDRSVGHQANLFGGAAVMVRHRAYYTVSPTLEPSL